MKKCSNCGALMSDDKTVCIDCGTRLGEPMSVAEENDADKAIDKYLSDKSEKTDFFYTPILLRILGIVSVIALIASIVLLNIAIGEKTNIDHEIEELGFSAHGGLYLGDGGADMSVLDAYTGRINELERCAIFCLFSIVLFAYPALMFNSPSAAWTFDTWLPRKFYNVKMEPTDAWLLINRIISFVLFVLGVCALAVAIVSII